MCDYDCLFINKQKGLCSIAVITLNFKINDKGNETGDKNMITWQGYGCCVSMVRCSN